MKPSAPLALALLLAATALAPLQAQTPTFTDPANLRGERVRPHDGRELPVDQGASGLQQLLRKLNTRASILNIVAHPDDEDGGMLTLYSRGLGARVADISLTRGEGGQNAATGDFEDALGLLRTQELLANDRYVGVDQMFGTEVDFGFSKTKEESFAKWTHKRVLYDVVRAIRIYRPLVLTATFIGGVTDGHGQHQVSGQIAQEAFVAAGDPKVFPELTAEGILPWQPLKIYARVPMQSISDKGLFDYATGQYTEPRFTNYVTGEVTTTTPSSDVIVHEGTQDPLLTHSAANPADINDKATNDPDTPFTYVQFARIGLGLQRSQVGPGVRDAPAGAFDVAYHLYGSRVSPTHDLSSRPERSAVERHAVSASATFFEGIDTSIKGIASLVPDNKNLHLVLTTNLGLVEDNIIAAQHAFDPTHPEALAPSLSEALKTIDSLIQQFEGLNPGMLQPEQAASVLHELRIKRVQLNDALALSLGVTIQATGNSNVVTVLTPAQVRVRISTSEKIAPNDFALVLAPHGNWEQASPCAGSEDTPHVVSPREFKQPVVRNCSTAPSQTSEVTRPYFTRTDIEQPIYQLLDPQLRNAPLAAPPLVALSEFHYQGARLEVSAVVEQGLQPVQIVPPASITTLSSAEVLPNNQPSVVVSLRVSPPDTRVEGDLPDNWKVTPDIQPKQSPSGFKQLRLELPPKDREVSTLHAIAVLPNNVEVREGYRPIGYGDLPRTNYFTPATDRIVPVDLNIPAHHNIAYLPGTGDDIPQALASIGLTPTILTIADLTPAHLKQFDTVILGVRTYNAHPDLHGKPTQTLLDYARNGGNVLVQYQSTEFTSEDAPYPLSLGPNEKVVDETAVVHLLSTNAPQLTTPNTITSADFNGWVEERGHGFLSEWDPHYTALTEVHDPGQLPQKGGLITTQLGKGHWTYCAFALYRQLPEAVPGAYRLFLNLLNP
jgi:LmbE family N-acetylglucosaminyl deacetylase